MGTLIFFKFYKMVALKIKGYGVICDLLQYTRTLKRNLFVLYIK